MFKQWALLGSTKGNNYVLGASPELGVSHGGSGPERHKLQEQQEVRQDTKSSGFNLDWLLSGT